MAPPIYTKEQVKEASQKYFGGQALPAGVFADKYALRDRDENFYELTPDEMHWRLAREFARIEQKYPNPLNVHTIYEYLKDFRYVVPQGSPMFGIGNNYQLVSLSNCAVLDGPDDNMSSIMEQGRDLANLYKRRFGAGIDISKLRPSGASVNNAAITSTGAANFMDLYSFITRMVGQSGRRGALMLTMDVSHPDIEKFVTMKSDPTKVTGANVSVRITDDFMKAVRDGKKYRLAWSDGKNTFAHDVQARDLFALIAEQACKTAEPGVLFWDAIQRNLPLDYYRDEGFETVSTNPCLRWDTMMLTDRGLLTIRQVAEHGAMSFWTPDGWKPGRAWFTGTKKVVRVTLSNGQSIVTTPDHKFAVGDEWIEAAQLGEGTKIVPMLGRADWSGDLDHSPVDLVRIGFIQGDGSFRQDCRALTVNLGENDDDVRPFFTGGTAHDDRRLYFGVDSEISDLVDCYDVARVPISERRLPTTVWSLPPAAMRAFLRGLYSANGSVLVEAGRITLKSTNLTMLREVQQLLLALGYQGYITTNRPAAVEWENGTYTGQESYDLNLAGSYARDFLNEIGFVQKYKMAALRELFLEKKGRRLQPTIVSIEEEGEADVYDFTVLGGPHCGWANGFLVHNCGELPLCSNDSCRLISIYLPSFVRDPFTEKARFDFNKFIEVVTVAQRLSDDLVDLELEKLRAIRDIADTEDEKAMFTAFIEKCENGRRTGLGTHGLADALARLRVSYSDEGALYVVHTIYGTLKNSAYQSSVIMAEERGAFPIWNAETEADCLYLKTLEPALQTRMAKSGRRNGALLTNAPTGSVSILSDNCSSGIEPVFANRYTRRRKIDPLKEDTTKAYKDANGDYWIEFSVFHPNVEKFLRLAYEGHIPEFINEEYGAPDKLYPWDWFRENAKLPDYFVTADQIDPLHRVRMQAAISHHIDHSVSSTINLPKGTTPQQIADIYMSAWELGCKGMTVYVDGSREAQVLTSTPDKKEEVKKSDITIGETTVIVEASAEMVEQMREEYLAMEKDLENVQTQLDGAERTITELRNELLGWEHNASFPDEDCGDTRTHRGIETTGSMYKAQFQNGDGQSRKVYVYVGANSDGTPVEVFIVDAKGDDDLKAYAESLGKLISLALKHGVASEDIENTLIGLRGESVSYTGKVFNSVPDLVGKRLRTVREHGPVNTSVPTTSRANSAAEEWVPEQRPKSFGFMATATAKVTDVTDSGEINSPVLDTGMKGTPQKEIPKGDKCPQCGETQVRRVDGCPLCGSCGWSRCS